MNDSQMLGAKAPLAPTGIITATCGHHTGHLLLWVDFPTLQAELPTQSL